MQSDEYRIRTMSRSEIDLAIDWAASEGWNPGITDAVSFYAADPEGFLMGSVDGNPVATISVVKYGSTYGFVGFFIVKPEFRGKGYGFPILRAGLDRLAGRNIGLDGVVEQQANYRKLGFKLAYRNIRYEGVRKSTTPLSESGIAQLATVPFESVRDYDRRFFFEERDAFLRAWITQPNGTALGIVDGGKLTGYGVIRSCRAGHKIGPLFANNGMIARELFHTLVGSLGIGETFYLDIPETNPDALQLVEENDMRVVFETARMYTKESPKLEYRGIYGVTSFELG